MDHETFGEKDDFTEEQQEIAGMTRFIAEVFCEADKEHVASALVSALIFMIWHSNVDFDAAIEEIVDGIKHMAELYKAQRRTERLQ